MREDKSNITIPNDFLLVRFELLKDLYSMNDYFSVYLERINRGFSDKKGFDEWINYIRKVYIQIRGSLNKEKTEKYKDLTIIMDRVLFEDFKLEDKVARKITMKFNDFLYETGLTDITQEKRDLGKIFGNLNN